MLFEAKNNAKPYGFYSDTIEIDRIVESARHASAIYSNTR